MCNWSKEKATKEKEWSKELIKQKLDMIRQLEREIKENERRIDMANSVLKKSA